MIERGISTRNLARIHILANSCWLYLITICSKLCLIPLKPSKAKPGHFDRCSFREQLIYYSTAIAGLALLGHKTVVTMDLLINEEISLRTYMCSCHVLLFFLAATACSGSTIKSREIQALVNSWEPILLQLEEIRGSRPAFLNITNLALKVIAVTWAFHVMVFNVSFLALSSTHFPSVCIHL